MPEGEGLGLELGLGSHVGCQRRDNGVSGAGTGEPGLEGCCTVRSNASWVMFKWGPPLLPVNRETQVKTLTSLAGGNQSEVSALHAECSIFLSFSVTQ